ncbi:MAG: NAD(P)/FAD-dependent oxidoreductase [Sorangiineae bacterium]|nr:NAD(P)/FAD-dependent oxidoreductase [Polyangiaceae bacterium]MEB2324057.1 NAD(P)/FAD-dependent oxidoreductase [Sorangiineae bacterium]
MEDRREVSVVFELDEPDDDARLREKVARAIGASAASLPELEVLRRSIDARRGRVRFNVLVGLGPGSRAPLGGAPPREVRLPARVVIVGDGPAGLFAAYELARAGVAAVVVERGKLVQPRRHGLAALNQRGEVDPESNYCFGEGGAGTYSDGKLYTRAHKRGRVRDVIELLAAHGAPEAILTDARPHIGSNRLPKVVTALRERLEAVGVVFRFESRVVELLVEGGSGRRGIAGVRLASGEELAAEAVVLATGHSARDVLLMLERAGVRLEPKPFALGVRVEHPQPLVDGIQYGRAAGHPRLPAASYRVAETIDGRGVFSFCMCPGGFVVPAATEPGGVVVNGMSLSRRDSPYANSGLVVAIEPEDVARAGFAGPLGGVELQRRLEEAAFTAGGGALRAPATRVTDFVAGRASATVPDSSYRPGLTAGELSAVLAATGLPVAERLRAALRAFGESLRGFLSEEAVLIGVESRTSSPVRVPRERDSLESPELTGLYPTGEGAGYAGGIVSAAVDGLNVAERVIARLAAR